MKKSSLNIVADPAIIETAKPKNDSRANRFGLSINISVASSPEYALALNTLKKTKVMLPLFKFYMDKLGATGLTAEQLVLKHKEVNKKILKQFQ